MSATLQNVTCYKQSEAECDEESLRCENCGKTMCFSHSQKAGGSWSDETMRVCDDCVAR